MVDDNKPTQEMQLKLLHGEVRSEVEYPQGYGLAVHVPKESEVIAGFFGGSREHGVVLTAFDPNSRPQGLSEGEVMLYNNAGTQVYLKQDGSVLLKADAVTIDANVTIKASVVIEGDLSVTGNVSDSKGSLEEIRAIYNQHVHRPDDPPPTPPMV